MGRLSVEDFFVQSGLEPSRQKKEGNRLGKKKAKKKRTSCLDKLRDSSAQRKSRER